MKKRLPSESAFTSPRGVLGLLLCVLGISLGMFSLAASPARTKGKVRFESTAVRPGNAPSAVTAANPSSFTLDAMHPSVTYTDGPTAPNPTGILGAPDCTAPNSCSDFTVTINASGLAATHNVTWLVHWTPANVDQDIFVVDTQGNLVANNNSTVDPSAIILPIPPDGTVYHLIVVASVGIAPIDCSVSLTTKFPAAQQGLGAPPRYINYPAGSNQANGDNEPSMGVDWNPNVPGLVDLSGQTRKNTGGVAFFTADTVQYRTNFDDCSSPAMNVWEDMNAPIITGLDPIGFVDHFSTQQLGLGPNPPHTPGRVFGLDLAAGTSTAAFSDNDGNSWTSVVAGNYPAGPDHETLGGGPFHAPIPTPPAPLYPNAIYYCSQNGAQNAECSRSDDGGATFGPGVPIFDATVCGGGIHGHAKVSPQGTVYVPNSSCGAGNPIGANGVAVSKDNGITWTEGNVPGSTGSQDPAVGIGQNNVGKPAGQIPNTLYLGWISGDGHAHVAHSPDEGTTWQDDTDISSIIGSQKSVFPVVVAGDDNRAAYGFLGTDPNFPNKQVWHLYIATTYNGGKNWILIDATPDDPVQIGNVCLLGIGCSGGRNLLDFNGIDVDREGRVLLGYTDGCVNCSNTQNITQSTQGHGTVARQSGGRRLFSAFDPVEPAPPPAPQVLSAVRVTSPAAGVLVSWLKPDNGGSPLMGYNIYRGVTSGSEAFIAHVSGADTTKYLDTGADPVNNSFYKVMAVNGVGESSFCHELSVNAVQPTETACQAPYITVTGAGTPGPTVPTDPTQGELTIQKVSVGEPFVSCTDHSITFVMKVNTLSPAPPPNGIWQILFDVPATVTTDAQPHRLFVEGTTASNPTTMSFSYGWRGAGPTGGSLDQGGPTAGKVTGTYAADGTITMKLNVSTPLIFNNVPAGTHAFDATISPGMLLTHLQGITYVLVGAQPGGTGGGSIQIVSQTSNVNSYPTTGNIGCSAGEPIAGLTATPMANPAPLNVSFDASSSNDTSPCATIVSYTLNFGDGSAPVTQTVAQLGANAAHFSHTYNSGGDFPARLTVADSAGRVSNPAQVVIQAGSSELALSGVVSRKQHGLNNPQDLALSLGNIPTVEPRAAGGTGVNGADYQLIFVFPNTLTSAGNPTATSTGAAPGNPTGAIGTDAHQYIVNLPNVPSGQYLTVTLNNVHDSTGVTGNVSATVGILPGDVDGNRRVDGNDVSAVQSSTRQNVTSINFRLDVDASGRIDGNDVSFVQSQTRKALPPLQ